MAEKHVYKFGVDENGNNVTEVAGKSVDEAKWITGGKGANLAEMANIGLPVPPGFSITCQTCVAYSSAGNVWPDGVLDEIDEYRKDLEKRMGKRIGDPDDPLLVSVRSGAPFSMPGMMDTVLNLGLNDESVNGLIKQTNNERFAWDSYRRFVQMFSDVVMGVDGQLFEDAINEKKAEKGVKLDTELTADDLKDLTETFKGIFAKNVDSQAHPEVAPNGVAEFPQDPYLQLRLAEQAVFGSWNTERAVLYRKQNKIPDDLGTAVNVQVMVFGNKGNTSATGVAFTRNPADGTNERYGDFLVNAQGEDVVAGIRNTEPIADLPKTPGLEEAGKELYHVFEILEDHYADMMDLEFTIEQGKLWMLQTRVGKRTALSALKVAMQMVDEGRITREQAIMRVAPEQLDQLLHPQFDPKAKFDVVAKGMNASPGAAVGAVVFSSDAAVHYHNIEKPCILVRWETTPDDLKGMVAAEGILTSHGGKTSHAAVIARGMGAPCVCGAEALKIDAKAKECKISGTDVVLHEGDIISINGTTGDIIVGAVPLTRPELTGDLTPPTRSSPSTSVPRASASIVPSTCSWATASRSSSRSSSPTTTVRSSRRSVSSSRHRPATSRVCSRPWTARPSSCVCSTRPCTSSSTTRVSLPSRSPAPRAVARPRSSSRQCAIALRASTPSRRPTPCSACAAAAWASCTPSSTTCRSAPSPAPQRR